MGTLGLHKETKRAKCGFVNLWFIELHTQLKIANFVIHESFKNEHLFNFKLYNG